MRRALALGSFVALAIACHAGGLTAAERAYGLPDVDIKQQVIWGSSCDGPGGTGLAFGGQDQRSDDGRPHTRIKQNGRWVAIHEKLRADNPLQVFCAKVWAIRDLQKNAVARARSVYFKGLSAEDQLRMLKRDVLPLQRQVLPELRELYDAFTAAMGDLDEYEQAQLRSVVVGLARGESCPDLLREEVTDELFGHWVLSKSMFTLALEEAAEALDAEPPPRALSPLVHEPKTGVYVLFGGDHCDYLTNDTWVFDPRKTRWRRCFPPDAPPPRANHQLVADGNGKIKLTGGYTYTSNTDYCGGQYRDLDDGPWTYDVAKSRWSGPGTLVQRETRTYRTGPFHPDFFLRAPQPDAAVHQKRLDALPANTWVAMDPPQLPRLNRDWGTAVLDPDHDVILRFSGGHSAHGGTDVLHYHLSTNRWELPFPVEFPLGQLYANTRYPNGFNFNLRPWVTGHTYQNYGYDPVLKKMLFAGRPNHYYVYDPVVADWTGRAEKPPAMVYNSCFYTITICSTPQGLVAWTRDGRVLRFEAGRNEWVEWELAGDELPGPVVDNSTVVYDLKRDRLLLAVKGYGHQHQYDGRLYAVDVKTRRVSTLSPEGVAAAGAIPYLCQIRYDAAGDLLLVGGTLPPGDDGLRRTPAYDCSTNRWISLRITGKDPSGEKGRNVSLGLMYDASRKLFWAVDTNSQVYVLRLEPQAADPQPLR